MPQQDLIVVVGCGSVGLPLAVALAVTGFDVCGYDIDLDKVERLGRGELLIVDPDLAAAQVEARTTGRLTFIGSLLSGLGESRSRIFVMAVPTSATNLGFDSHYFDAGIAAIKAVAHPGDAIMVRSTVPIGMTRNLSRILTEELAITFCPDRTVAGCAYRELFEIPHIVAGIDARSSARAAKILSRLGRVVEVESLEAAEALKLFSNMQRMVLLGLANECALICEERGLDLYGIIEASARDYPRHVLPRPGPVGGPCLPKDVDLLAASLPKTGVQPRIAQTARSVNEGLLDHVCEIICSHLSSVDRQSPVAVILGLAFKGRPATADTRGSFAVALGQRLRQRLAAIAIHWWDPELTGAHSAVLGMTAFDDVLSATKGADVVVFANNHKTLAGLDLAALATVARKPTLFYDLCGDHRHCAATLPPGTTLRAHGIGRESR